MAGAFGGEPMPPITWSGREHELVGAIGGAVFGEAEAIVPSEDIEGVGHRRLVEVKEPIEARQQSHGNVWAPPTDRRHSVYPPITQIYHRVYASRRRSL
jgi:hypothetical protein